MIEKSVAQDRTQRVTQALLSSDRSIAHLMGDRWAEWFAYGVSDIAVLIGDSEIHVTAATISDGATPEKHVVQLAAWADDLVVVLDGCKDDGKDERTTRAFSRAALHSLTVGSPVQGVADWWPADWPGKLRVSLDYGDHGQFTLSSVDDALIPSLRADLVVSP